MSTDNIGLARLREGLELVRIGEPQRPEFAALESAWREAEQIAAIADNLLVPSETEMLIARHRGKVGEANDN